MYSKYTYLKALNKNIDDKEHAYALALDKFELNLSKINKGIIHGVKEQYSINMLKSFVSELMRASYELELAVHKKSLFIKYGVIKYE